MTPAEKDAPSLDFGHEISKQLTIHKNFNQEIIVTTSDKLKLVLIETKESLTAKRDWITPFGLTISFVATLCTADFKEAFGLNKEFWHALFVLLTIASGLVLIKSLVRLALNWRTDDVHKIIERIKPETEDRQVEVTQTYSETLSRLFHVALFRGRKPSNE